MPSTSAPPTLGPHVHWKLCGGDWVTFKPLLRRCLSEGRLANSRTPGRPERGHSPGDSEEHVGAADVAGSELRRLLMFYEARHGAARCRCTRRRALSRKQEAENAPSPVGERVHGCIDAHHLGYVSVTGVASTWSRGARDLEPAFQQAPGQILR